MQACLCGKARELSAAKMKMEDILQSLSWHTIADLYMWHSTMEREDGEIDWSSPWNSAYGLRCAGYPEASKEVLRIAREEVNRG
jgi:hypothetical protein